MATNNYGFGFMPQIIKSGYGDIDSSRTTYKIPMKNSAALYLGQFVSDIQGTQAAPTGPEFGVPGYTAHNAIAGFVVGFSKKTGLLPLIDDSNASGTVTNATGQFPYKYTAASTNDESNTSSAILELVEIMPIFNGDILKVALFGAGSITVVRGTTTAAGTTGSSDNIGIGLGIDSTHPWALLESSAAKSVTSSDFVTVSLDGQKPMSPYFVYVRPLRGAADWFPTLN